MASLAVQRIKREFKEVVKSEEISKCQIKVELKNDSFTELRGEIAGPPDTPYEGGTFILDIKIPETYPFNPPKVQFVTKIWHPNISSVTGAICLDILKDQWLVAIKGETKPLRCDINSTLVRHWAKVGSIIKPNATLAHRLEVGTTLVLSGKTINTEATLDHCGYLLAAAMTLRTVLLSLQALLAAAEPDDPQDAVVAKQYKEEPEIFKLTARHWTNAYAGGPKVEIEYDRKVEQLKNMGFDAHKGRVALSTHNWNVERATEYMLS